MFTAIPPIYYADTSNSLDNLTVFHFSTITIPKQRHKGNC